MSIEKKITKQGKVVYYDNSSKKFTSANKYVKSNIGKIKTGRIDYNDLSKNQKLAFQALTRTTYKNKFIGKNVERVIIKEAENAGIKINKGDKLEKYFGDSNPVEIVRDFEEIRFVKNYSQTKTKNSVFAIQAEAIKSIKKGNSFFVIDENGKRHNGLDGVHEINVFEDKTRRENIKTSPMFIHHFKTVFDENMNIEESVDLRDTVIIISD